MVAGNNDSVRFDVQIEAEAAVRSLRELIAQAQSVPEKVKVFTNALSLMSKKLNVDWQTLLVTFRQLNAEMSRQHQATIFGNVGGQPVFQMAEQFMQSKEAAEKSAAAVAQHNKVLEQTETSSRRAVRGLDAVRIAMGAIVAMIVFQAIQAIQNFFRSAIEGATNLEMGFYRLEKAERSLSEAGVEISPKGMQKGMEELQKQFKFLSDVDITKLLGNVSLLTKELNLNEDQIVQLSKSIILLNIASQENEDILQTSQKVITAMITGQARGATTLGLSFSDNALQAKAMEMGILKAGEAVSKLTDAEKAQVKLAITIDTADLERATEDVSKYENTLEGLGNTTKNTWESVTVVLGQIASPIIKEGLKILIHDFEMLQALLTAMAPKFGSLMAIFVAFTESIAHGTSLYDEWVKANDEIQAGLQGLADAVDTPTASVDNLADAFLKLQEAAKNAKFDDLLKDMEDFQQKAEELNRTFNTKMDRMLEDFNIDQERAAEDYSRNVQETQEDFARRRAEAEQKYRDNEVEAEAKFQERLRQLRERFLYNLEDALHERDARQVLRLIREYQMEKQNITNEEALRKEAAIREHQEEMERLKQEEQDRLRQLAEEYEIKKQRAQEDYELKKARETEEHEQDMADLQARKEERLKEFSQALADELGLREGGADAIYKMLQSYYGKDAYFDQLYKYSAESMQSRAQNMLEMLQSIVAQYQQTIATISNPNFGSAPRIVAPGGLGSAPNYPQPVPPPSGGGLGSAPRTSSLSAFRPPSLSMGMGGDRGGAGGQIGIEVILSPDLEARVVENSVNAVADVVTKVRRTK